MSVISDIQLDSIAGLTCFPQARAGLTPHQWSEKVIKRGTLTKYRRADVMPVPTGISASCDWALRSNAALLAENSERNICRLLHFLSLWWVFKGVDSWAVALRAGFSSSDKVTVIYSSRRMLPLNLLPLIVCLLLCAVMLLWVFEGSF